MLQDNPAIRNLSMSIGYPGLVADIVRRTGILGTRVAKPDDDLIGGGNGRQINS